MNILRLNLLNCYGIKKLQTDIDFSQNNACAIYAPNGSMKSSLAQTFKDAADNVASKDRIFATRATTRSISDENNAALPADQILVIRPYDDTFSHTAKTSTLLVDPKLRQEYERLYIEIDRSKDAFLTALKAQSGTKKDIEKEISSTFTASDDQFYRALIRIRDEISSQKDAPYSSLTYDTIFDEKVLSFLGTKDFKTAIQDYITKYNELLAASTYFKKGIFNYYNAATIAKSLADNGFFNAQHSVSLNANEKLEITTQKQLEEFIAKEKEKISNDKELRKKYSEIDKLITKNANVRDFESYIAANEFLLPRLANVVSFKEDVWKSYIKVNAPLYEDLLSKFQAAAQRKKEIEEAASKQRTQWEEVIQIFNQRFFVPFKLEAKNRIAVILGNDPMLALSFTYEDGADTTEIDKSILLQALSMGEKKALYILNVIFEIEVRKKANAATLLIVDDIADSFDYKNKYAIIQYLKDIADDHNFKQLILTHNFDFFRTINTRFSKAPQSLIATKSSFEVTFKKATGIRNIFVKDWKPNLFSDLPKRLASIPFVRNLIEYTKSSADPDFTSLTSLLHWKVGSQAITHKMLDDFFINVFGIAGAWPSPNQPVVDDIFSEAHKFIGANASINFENKIVLSIAIRLAAERFMVNKINDPAFVSAITSNQTPKLFDKFKQLFKGDSHSISTIQRVLLMTPENIHMNAFMYEPILDMSDDHLRKLYQDISALK